MSFLRYALRHQPIAHHHPLSRTYSLIPTTHLSLHKCPLPSPSLTRTYASKSKEPKSKESKSTSTSTAHLIPGSLQPITNPTSLIEFSKCETSMRSSVEWFKKECATIESRASGRITPSILSGVRVKLPKRGNGGELVSLEEISTVGVRDGSTLMITVFEEENFKFIEQALYESKIPNVIPQRQDSRTIKIPIPRPTVEARLQAYTATQRKAEEVRVQIRKQHQTSLKRGKYEKRSVELTEFQKLTDKYVKEVDTILAGLKKAVGAK
ncbi:ribosome recycling factor [Pluteus cervinus]|uniref:Ribosome recycling factor n=1 Tax=Pluteus cervinus TaxID=181527 RepID=A0ACD3APE0_9AGAR|nr:ribosome recycling factor [Pluteus cervinus]